MRPAEPAARGRVWDVLFFALVASFVAVPLAGPDELAQSSGGSGGSASAEGGASASGGSGSGSGSGEVDAEAGASASGGSGSGSGQVEAEGSASGGSGSGGVEGEVEGGVGGSVSTGRPSPPGEPPDAATPPPTAQAAPPPPGTRVRTRADRLPPYVPLVCLAGKVPGVEAEGDVAAAQAAQCRSVRVEEVDEGFVLFSSNDTDVEITDVDLDIRVEQASPPVVVVTPSYGGDNRVLLSLFAAGLLVVIAGGIALALRQRRAGGSA